MSVVDFPASSRGTASNAKPNDAIQETIPQSAVRSFLDRGAPLRFAQGDEIKIAALGMTGDSAFRAR